MMEVLSRHTRQNKETFKMKKYYIIHDGLVYAANVYASNKRQAIAEYRKKWNLENRRINLVIWEG